MRTTALIVGSRASALAKAQVREVLDRWHRGLPDVEFRQQVILEGGDRDRRTPTLAEVARDSGGSAFSSNQEAALARGDVDVIVHSLKDLPTATAEGLVLLPTPGPRADVRDVLCGATLDALPRGARVGTGSPRRIAQLLALRPDLEILPVRGNVPARLARARHKGGSFDAVVLAAAGLHRLGLGAEISEYLDPETFPPSPGQGALGIQVRAGGEAQELLGGFAGDPEADAQVRAERSLLAELHGGCSVPVGTWTSHPTPGTLRLHAAVTSLDGARQATATRTGPADEPEKLGLQTAADLHDRGAAAILAAIRP